MKQTRRDPHEGLKAQIYQKLNKFAKEFGFDELPLLVKNSCWDRKKGQFKLIGDKAFLAQINNAVEERREQLERKREEQAAQRGRVIISQAKPAPEEKMGEKGGGAAAPTARPARAELPRSEPERTEDSALPAGEPVAPLIEEKREGIPAPPVKRRRRSKVLPPTSKEEVVRSLKEFVRFFGFEQLPESVKQLVDSERNLRLPDDQPSLTALVRDIRMRGWGLEAAREKGGAKRGRGKRGRRKKKLPANIEKIIKDRSMMTLKELAKRYDYPGTSAVYNVLMAAEEQGYKVNAPERWGIKRRS